MITGLGTDIVMVDRMKPLIMNKSMCDKIFTENEQEYFNSKKQPYVHAAGMWAAKESFIKASGETGKPMNKIEVIHDEYGKPELCLYETYLHWVTNLSISHDGSYATAVVIVEHPV